MKRLLICSSLVLSIIICDVNAGMKDVKNFLKGGAILASLMPQMMPLPLPLPIPIRLEREHHHTYPVCKSKPVHHFHKTVEYVPIEVEKKPEKSYGKKGEIEEEMGEEHRSSY